MLETVTEFLHQAYLAGGLNRSDVVTVLTAIDEHLEKKKTPPHLSVCDWSALQDCIRPHIPARDHPDRSTWVRLHLHVLLLNIGDLSRSVRSSRVSYWERLAWLEQLVDELSPAGYVRTVLVRDSDPEFGDYVATLIALTTQVARKIGAPAAIERLQRYKQPKSSVELKLLHIGAFGPVTEPEGIHATIAFV